MRVFGLVMTYIRQALHSATRSFVRSSHDCHAVALMHHETAFSAAVSGHQIPRKLALNRMLDAFGRAKSYQLKAHRAQGMMK